MLLHKKNVLTLLLIVSLPIKAMQNSKNSQPSALKSSHEKTLSGYFIDFSKFIIPQCILTHGTIAASTLGHELGHAAIPFMYGGKPQIKVDFIGSGGHCIYSTPVSKAKIAHKLSPLVSGLWPIAGITTSLGILAASNVYYEYNNPYFKHKSTQERIKNGVQKELVNKDQQIGLMAGAMINCLRQAHQLKIFKGPNIKGIQTLSDGQNICNHFSLPPKKALLASRAMQSVALVPFGYLLKESYDVVKNSF